MGLRFYNIYEYTVQSMLLIGKLSKFEYSIMIKISTIFTRETNGREKRGKNSTEFLTKFKTFFSLSLRHHRRTSYL